MMKLSNRLRRVAATIAAKLRTPNWEEPDTYRIRGYHSTLVDYWPSIREGGLVPGANAPSGQDWEGDWSGKGVYVHQTLPMHELENGVGDDGSPFLCVVEFLAVVAAAAIVPDEEAGPADYATTAIHNKEPIVIGRRIDPLEFVTLHLIDTPQARAWAHDMGGGNYKFHMPFGGV